MGRLAYFWVGLVLMAGAAWGQEAAQGAAAPGSAGGAWMGRMWEAQWITHPSGEWMDYGVYHFRRTFEMDVVPDAFVLHVSGDNRYRLFVNGVSVCAGPARGDLLHWRYETVDVAKHLKAGKNVLAAVVLNWGPYRPWAQFGKQTAFILQGDGEAEKVVNTDDSWKVVRNEGYRTMPAERFKATPFNVIGAGEDVDASKYPWGWQGADFDDSRWEPAWPLGRGAPRGIRDGSRYWMLVPREIPMMEERLERIGKLVRATGLEEAHGEFLTGKKALEVPANTTAAILLDLGHVTTAYPELTVSGGEGAKVRMTYAEALVDQQGRKGNRNEVEGRQIRGYFDVFDPDGGEGRVFRPLWFRTYRYVQLDVETGEAALRIDDVKGWFTGYPFEEKAYFKSSDESLKPIWDVGWRTMRLCAGETYYDCPYYEQLQYVGDTRVQGLISVYVSGDDRLLRKAIRHFDDSRISDGLTYSRYPSHMPQIIPPYSLFWIAMLHDHWMLRGDREFIEPYMAGVRGILGWYEDRIDKKTGLLGPMEWWNFVDWAEGWPSGVPAGGEEGGSSIITLQLIYNLQYAAELAEAFGRTDEAKRYTELATKLKQAVQKHCWDEEKGLYADTPAKKNFSQHANVMAVLAEAPLEDLYKPIMEKVAGDESLTQCTFYYRYYLMRALKKAGMGDRYVGMLGPWHKMLEMGLTTFAEKPEPTRSDCHAWSACPNYDLLSLVCGIEPGAPGFASVRIEPSLGPLEWVEGQVATERGPIRVHLRRDGEAGLQAEVELPPETKGVLLWNGKDVPLSSRSQSITLH